MKPYRNAARTFPVRPGFTLLELLLAVGLTSILMVALFSALNISFNLQLDSHEEITRQQIARSLLRQMTRDIQSVVFVKKTVTEEDEENSKSSSTSSSKSSTSSSNSGTTSTSTASSSTTSSGSSTTSSGSLDGNSYGETAIDPETVMTAYSNGLVGTTSDLQLFVSHPDRNLAYVTAQELTSGSERTSDLLIVRYLMADKGAGGLASAIAERDAPGADNGPIGLVRMSGDLFGLSSAVETSEEYPQLAAAKLQAKEVSKIQFRYFDGMNWQEKWDSTSLNEMPKAVEIILTLRDEQNSGAAFDDKKVDPYALPETTHRMVVPIPVAEPFVTETAL
jgi:prepilin-type N-terminal cleavage/methylation domain-containing protein